MKVLLDVGVSPRLRQLLKHQLGGIPVESAVYRNWRSLPDNELLAKAERDGFTTVITTDKRMAEEQRHATIAIVAIDDNSLGGLLAAASSLADAVRSTFPGESRLVSVARMRRLTRDRPQ